MLVTDDGADVHRAPHVATSTTPAPRGTPPASSAPSSSARRAPTSSPTSTRRRRPRATGSTCSAPLPGQHCRPSGACRSPRASPTCCRSTPSRRRSSTRATAWSTRVWVVDDPERLRGASPSPSPPTRSSSPTGTTATRPRSPTGPSASRPTATPARPRPRSRYVVELVEDELTVRAIHRLVDGLPAGIDLVAALDPWFEADRPAAGRRARHAGDAAGRGAVRGDPRRRGAAPAPARRAGRHRATSTRPGSTSPSPRCPTHGLRFQHGVDNVRAAVADGDAQSGVLLRPATVAQIEDTAARRRAHAAEDHVLPPQAPHRARVPRPRLSPRRRVPSAHGRRRRPHVPPRQPPGRHRHHPGRRHDADVADHGRRRRRRPRAWCSTRETAYKVAPPARPAVRRLCAFTDGFFGEWVQVEGPVDIVSLPDAMEPLVDYYRSIRGEHPDWDDYRAAWSATGASSCA